MTSPTASGVAFFAPVTLLSRPDSPRAAAQVNSANMAGSGNSPRVHAVESWVISGIASISGGTKNFCRIVLSNR